MGGSTNFGSRSEFLPGGGCEQTDIKYQRYGGCFVTYKKGIVYVLVSVLLAAIVGLLVYHYVPCRSETDNEYASADDFISELTKTASRLEKTDRKETLKLPTNIVPSYYRLRIRPYLHELEPKQFTFEGRVGIVFNINGPPTTEIILNVKNLTISETDVSITYTSTKKIEPLQSDSQIKENENDTDISTNTTQSGDEENEILTTELPLNITKSNDNITSSDANENGTEEKVDTKTPLHTTTENSVLQVAENVNIQIETQEYNALDETYKIHLKYPLQKDVNYTMDVKFSGNMSNGYGGILRSSYKQENNTLWLAATSFKPSFARMAFPCFDDPTLKARFELSVARETNMTVVANMRLKNTQPIDDAPGWVWDHFEISPVMATYSVAFAVFGFNPTKIPSPELLPVTKLWGRTDIISKATYIQNIVPEILDSYNELLHYKYPLPKIDLVAIPDFPVSAISSWGLVLFRENNVLVDDKSSQESKETLREIVSQSLANQWFDNLISPHSWNDSWFIDTLSHYVQFVTDNNTEKWQQNMIQDSEEVLDIDSTNLLPALSTFPVNYFDNDKRSLLYKKGSSIFSMLTNRITRPVFLKTLQTFIEKWQYKTIESDNLWEDLTNSSNESLPVEVTIKDIINLWTTQKGYPLLTVTRDYENESFSVKQYRFTERQVPSNNLWIVPLDFTSSKSSGNSTNFWLLDTSPKLFENITGKENNSWVLFNSRQTCLCRVNYDLNNWNSLISLLKSEPETLSSVSRAQLLDDAFHLARTGLLNYTVALDMTQYLQENEQHPIPWATALRNIADLDLLLRKTSNYGEFQDYILSLLLPTYKRLGINPNEDDSESVKKLRTQIVSWTCNLNYKPCVDWAYSQYLTWANFTDPDKINQIDVDLRPIVYCISVQMRGRSAWDFLWDRYLVSKDNPSETKALLTGLGCSKQTWILTKYLHKVLNESIYISMTAWESLSSSDHAIDVAFDFLRDNWNTVRNSYANYNVAFKKILNGILSRLTTKHDLDEMVRFFSTRKDELPHFASEIAAAVEKLKLKLDWKKNYLSTFNQWIHENKS